MLGNLLGFDIEAELRCAATKRWIRKEERAVRKMEKKQREELETTEIGENDSEEKTTSNEEEEKEITYDTVYKYLGMDGTLLCSR